MYVIASENVIKAMFPHFNGRIFMLLYFNINYFNVNVLCIVLFLLGKCSANRNNSGASPSHQYLTNVQSWNIRFGHQTIHPTQKFTSMNVLQMPCVITWA